MAKFAAAIALGLLLTPFAAAQDNRPMLLVYIICENRAAAAEQATKEFVAKLGENWSDFQFKTQVDKYKVMQGAKDKWSQGELKMILPLTEGYPMNSNFFIFMDMTRCEIS